MPQTKRPRIVMVGGGHAHVGVLRRLIQRPAPDIDIQLVTPDTALAYSGMVPGRIAGHYTANQATLDLVALSAAAGVRFVADTLATLEPDAGVITLASGRSLSADVVSLNTGASGTPKTIEIEDDAPVYPVKPVGQWLDALNAFDRDGESVDRPATIAIAGGGPGGVELCLSLAHRYASRGLPTRLLLICGRAGLLPKAPARARIAIARELSHAGVTVIESRSVIRVKSNRLILDDGTAHDVDLVLLATGASAPDWARASGLAVDSKGFVAVRWTLRSCSHPRVFAAGDIAALPTARPKSGVVAVREGPILAENLLRAARGAPLIAYKPKSSALALISLGDRRAIAIRGRLSLPASRLLWQLKDRIDRHFTSEPAAENDSRSQV